MTPKFEDVAEIHSRVEVAGIATSMPVLKEANPEI